MNTTEKKKAIKGSTIYITSETLEELNDLELSLWTIKFTSNTDKIAYLINFYKESLKK